MERIPNLISLIRLLLSPSIFLLYREEEKLTALFLFTVLAISDAMDGFLARKLKAETKLGKFLDPLADKVLILFGLLAITYESPFLFIAVILRDTVLIVGSLYLKQYGFIPEPSIWGKLTTLFLSLTVITGFLRDFFDIYRVYIILEGISLGLVIVSGIDYVRKGILFVIRVRMQKTDIII